LTPPPPSATNATDYHTGGPMFTSLIVSRAPETERD